MLCAPGRRHTKAQTRMLVACCGTALTPSRGIRRSGLMVMRMDLQPLGQGFGLLRPRPPLQHHGFDDWRIKVPSGLRCSPAQLFFWPVFVDGPADCDGNPGGSQNTDSAERSRNARDPDPNTNTVRRRWGHCRGSSRPRALLAVWRESPAVPSGHQPMMRTRP